MTTCIGFMSYQLTASLASAALLFCLLPDIAQAQGTTACSKHPSDTTFLPDQSIGCRGEYIQNYTTDVAPNPFQVLVRWQGENHWSEANIDVGGLVVKSIRNDQALRK